MCKASRVCISSSPCRCGAIVPGVLACVHTHIHMRMCVDVYAYICADVHMCVYMHMRVRPCTRTCARVCMRMHVHTYARMEGPGGGASACQAVSWARVRTHVHVHACARVYAWARMCTACSECGMENQKNPYRLKRSIHVDRIGVHSTFVYIYAGLRALMI